MIRFECPSPDTAQGVWHFCVTMCTTTGAIINTLSTNDLSSKGSDSREKSEVGPGARSPEVTNEGELHFSSASNRGRGREKARPWWAVSGPWLVLLENRRGELASVSWRQHVCNSLIVCLKQKRWHFHSWGKLFQRREGTTAWKSSPLENNPLPGTELHVWMVKGWRCSVWPWKLGEYGTRRIRARKSAIEEIAINQNRLAKVRKTWGFQNFFAYSLVIYLNQKRWHFYSWEKSSLMRERTTSICPRRRSHNFSH